MAFRTSEIFRYTRPCYRDFPQDSVASFANLYRQQLRDPHAIVIVAEDWERAEVDDIPDVPPPEPPDAESHGTLGHRRVVVGTASWRLPAASPHSGQFVVLDTEHEYDMLHRDESAKRKSYFYAVNDAGERKWVLLQYFPGCGQVSPTRVELVSALGEHCYV